MVFCVDHMVIKYLVNKAKLSGRLARWVLILEDFDYTVEYKFRTHVHMECSKHLGHKGDLGMTPYEYTTDAHMVP